MEKREPGLRPTPDMNKQEDERPLSRRAAFDKRICEALGADTYEGLGQRERDIIFDALRIRYELSGHPDNYSEWSNTQFSFMLDWLAFLSEKNVLNRFFSLQPRRRVETDQYDAGREAEVGAFTVTALGKNFVYNNVADIFERHRERGTHTPTDESPGLFHATPDQHVIKILKNKFKISDEHQKTHVGTGKFEKDIGLQGIFVTRGHTYRGVPSGDTLLDTDVVIVFDEKELEKPHTIGIRSEVSIGRIHEGIAEGIQAEGLHKKQQSYADRTQRDALAAALELLDSIVPPEFTEANEYFELCLDVNEVGLPTMMFVGEEPEWYYEEAKTHWPEFAASVAIISQENIIRALERTNQNMDFYTATSEELIDTFTALVQDGKLNLSDWAYQPTDEIPSRG